MTERDSILAGNYQALDALYAREQALRSVLSQTTFALETVVMLGGGKLRPEAARELIKYIEQAKRALA